MKKGMMTLLICALLYEITLLATPAWGVGVVMLVVTLAFWWLLTLVERISSDMSNMP